MFRPQDIDKYNQDVAAWTKDTKNAALAELDKHGVVHSPKSKSPVPLRKALKTALRKNGGVTNRISFKIPRHAVFLHKGVGRGTTASQAGSTNRKAKPFLNPPIEQNIGKLAELVADHQGTMIVNALMIK
ncbi:hypothetical protein SAMN05444008_11561 [Cnuella takakiae]|uniref:Uncharacterized protein n=1 Tax=Cnuella takakiae TaxID=1302690 RepID=A0A1M5G1I7_9BACT|nr:hypothetical protein [Cnuella takakiae]OLY92295.1 hypothetical protein BUE76_10615 [Cnuella takakiae]SHF97566.1 hypothetical protein SAMN05444008_11561 [Cnuella takakiae]